MNACVKKKKIKERKTIDKNKARTITCIVCPTCCDLETDGAEVNGARCLKGETFARQEMVMPLRVVTTTVRCETPEGVRMIPVKTTSPVPMAQIFEIMKSIKGLRLSEVPAIGATITAGPVESPMELVVTGELD
jgi:CxxC motif-containing protein